MSPFTIKIFVLLGLLVVGGVATQSPIALLTAFFAVCMILSFTIGAFWAVKHDARIERLKNMRHS